MSTELHLVLIALILFILFCEIFDGPVESDDDDLWGVSFMPHSYLCLICLKTFSRGLLRLLDGIPTMVCRKCGKDLPKPVKGERYGSSNLFLD